MIIRYITLSLLFVLVTNILSGKEKESVGKIWYADGYLYANIVNKGVWIIDNSNPENPIKKGFIKIPGNIDISVKGDILFADNHEDLIAVNIADKRRVYEVKRIRNVFESRGIHSDDEKQIFYQPEHVVMGLHKSSKGGSMSCFTISENYMYVISGSNIKTFDIFSPENIKDTKRSAFVGSDIETLFNDGNTLYIGAQSGMYIYDIEQQSGLLNKMSKYNHMRTCDPVVVSGDYAFVTMRNGRDCGGTVNQLDVIDISNKSNPRKIGGYGMTNPHGLAVDGSLLFICDGNAGLKIFDIRNINAVTERKTFNIGKTYDIIALEDLDVLIVVSGNNLIQYRYSNDFEISKLSTFTIK